MIKEDSQETNLIELGKFYFVNNKFDEAIAEFKKILEVNPSNAEVYYNLGLIKEVSNLPTEAKDMYSKALAIRPDYKIARDRLNKLTGVEN
jgi:tetratricopeptide (TPR) repeat protein